MYLPYPSIVAPPAAYNQQIMYINYYNAIIRQSNATVVDIKERQIKDVVYAKYLHKFHTSLSCLHPFRYRHVQCACYKRLAGR